VTYDAAAPTIAIISPTSDPTFSTDAWSVDIGGTASDDVGLASVTYSLNGGAAIACTGTTTWTAEGVALTPGTNAIVVTATDVASRTSTATLTVTCTPPRGVVITSPTADPSCARNCANLSIAGNAYAPAGLTAVS
jgi:hypothetical protein